MRPTVESMIYIQSYKYNGLVHRTWSKAFVLKETKDCIITVTHKTWVIESDGRRWFTKEPAICFFYPDRWYNIISMIRKSGIYYYCNVATPCVYDGEALKNIDLDLDVKVFPNGDVELLDEDEFEEHQKQMQYDQDIIDLAKDAAQQLLDKIKKEEYPFNHQDIYTLFDEYLQKSQI